MSEILGAVAYDEHVDNGGGYMSYHEKSYSEETAKAIDDEVRKLLEEAHKRATEVILAHRKEVELMTAMLIEFETLDAQDVKDIINNEWDSEKKKRRLKDVDKMFKRETLTPPPPPELNGPKGDGIVVDDKDLPAQA